MGIRITSTGTIESLPQRLRDRAKFLLPATRRFGEEIAREARRRAPVGKGRDRGALRRSLNHAEVGENVTVLQSPLAYAQVAQFGGPITAGKGPLGSRLLAIPLNATAQAMLDGLGASVSLRSQDLTFIKTRRGRMVLIQAAAKRGPRQKALRGAKRQHTMFGGQVLFVLVPRVQHPAQPYAPRVSEQWTRNAAQRAIRAHLTAAG